MDGEISRWKKFQTGVKTCFKWFTRIMVGVAVIGWATQVIVGNLVWDKDQEAASAPSPTPTATEIPITWFYLGGTCRDGWGSPSIGKRGACSHHGGVVYSYKSEPGGLVTWCGPKFQPKTLEEAQRLLDTTTGKVGCAIPDH
jgi:hypothetical protein